MGTTPVASKAPSRSVWIGSSGKNRGTAPRLASASVTPISAAARHATRRTLEDMAESQNKVLSSAAAKGPFDSKEDAVSGAKAEPDAVIGFEIPQVQILQPGRHLARVIKDRAIDRGEDLPAILRLEQ